MELNNLSAQEVGLSTEKSTFQKFKELLDKAGSQRQTPEQIAWIKPPESIDPSVIRNRVYPDILMKISERDSVRLENYGMSPLAFSVFWLAGVPSDNEAPEERIQPFEIPESYKVNEFIEFIEKSETPIDTVMQLEKLLELSDGSITDAAMLGMLASRIVARNVDKSMYPDIQISEETRDAWSKNLLPFEKGLKPQDKLGDNYYFWTSIYTKVAFETVTDRSLFYKTMDMYSAQVMGFSRRYLAKQSTVTDHLEAFKQGKATANILINSVKNKSG